MILSSTKLLRQKLLLTTSSSQQNYMNALLTDIAGMPRKTLQSQVKDAYQVEPVEKELVDDDENEWKLFSCCMSRSIKRESHLTKVLMGTYNIRPTKQELLPQLKIGLDGSLVVADNVDMNQLIEGFREFERRFQYGNLSPFANVLPVSTVPTDLEEDPSPSTSSAAGKQKKNVSFENSWK